MKTRSNSVQVHVGGPPKMGERFAEAWKRAESGKLKARERHITFPDLPTLLGVLTPKRWELLCALRQTGPLSVRALALHLKRDYKRVHTDVATLASARLIETDDAHRVCVPWDAVDASLSLAA